MEILSITKQTRLMNTDRIKEIQEKTAYPNSVSVQQALLQVWNESQQDMADDLEAILNNSIYVDFISKKEIVKYLKSLNKQD